MNIQQIFYTYLTTHKKELELLCKNILIKYEKKTNDEKQHELLFATFEVIQKLLDKKSKNLKNVVKNNKIENFIKHVIKLQYQWSSGSEYAKNTKELYGISSALRKIEIDDSYEEIKDHILDEPTDTLQEELYQFIDDIYSYCDKKKIENKKYWDRYIFLKLYYKYNLKQNDIAKRFNIPTSSVSSGIKYAKDDIIKVFKDKIQYFKDNGYTNIL